MRMKLILVNLTSKGARSVLKSKGESFGTSAADDDMPI